MEIAKEVALFTLFHHDITYQSDSLNFNAQHLYNLSKKPVKYGLKDIAEGIFSIVTDNLGSYKDSEITLTLTGGMDSRVILAALLKAGVKPICMTFGHSQANDVVLAKNIAYSFGLHFHNACQGLPNKDWYYKWVIETIKCDNGNSHLHRAHRMAAIEEHMELYHPKVLYTGHMGGEGLRFFTYNNYLTSRFFEWVNEGIKTPEEAALNVWDDYFLRKNVISWQELYEIIIQFPWMNHDRETNKFFFLYELSAKIHHAQDLRLYQSIIPNVIPVFLKEGYLNLLFRSPYHFLNQKDRIFNRIRNPYIYCKVIKYLYPKLLEYPLTNNFAPNEYLRGLWYYLPAKLYRDYTHKKNFISTFSYGKWYVDFVKEHAQNINPEIWEIYDKKRYFESISKNNHLTEEGYWHKFSNPVFFDLVRKYKNGKI